MSLPETKRLLRTFRILPNKLLGQNFMVEPAFYSKLCEYACLSKDDVLLDVGAGFGFLTQFLASNCKTVIAVEKDPRVAAVLREQVKGCENVIVVEGDVLKVDLPAFDKVVAIPPYYLSSKLIVWLLEHKIQCVVMILQKEFAAKFVAPAGSESYGWLTVIVSHKAEAELLDMVPKMDFYPMPEVDSVIVRLTRRATPPFRVGNDEIYNLMVRWLFTQRNKKISNGLVSFLRNVRRIDRGTAEKLVSSAPFGERRVWSLSPKEFGELADALKL